MLYSNDKCLEGGMGLDFKTAVFPVQRQMIIIKS